MGRAFLSMRSEYTLVSPGGCIEGLAGRGNQEHSCIGGFPTSLKRDRGFRVFSYGAG